MEDNSKHGLINRIKAIHFRKEAFLPSLFLALTGLYYTAPDLVEKASSFDRTMNQLTMQGASIEGRLFAVNIEFLCLCPILILALFWAVSYLMDFAVKRGAALPVRFLNELSVLFLVLIPFYFKSRLEEKLDGVNASLSLLFLAMSLLIFVVTICFEKWQGVGNQQSIGKQQGTGNQQIVGETRVQEAVEKEYTARYLKAFVGSVSAMLVLRLCSGELSLSAPSIGSALSKGNVLIGIAGFTALLLLGKRCENRKEYECCNGNENEIICGNEKCNENGRISKKTSKRMWIDSAVVYLAALPLVLTLTRELFYILAARGIHVGMQLPILIGVAGLLLVVVVLWQSKIVRSRLEDDVRMQEDQGNHSENGSQDRSFVKKVNTSKHDAWKVSYLFLLLSAGAVLFLPTYSMEYDYVSNAYLFELGNTSSVLQSAVYGKLPVAGFFSAHLLSDIWDGLIYIGLNGDVNGALLSPYRMLEVFASILVMYGICKELFGRDRAFLIAFLLPICTADFKGATVNMIAIIVLYYAIKKQTLRSYLLFWGVMLLGLLFRLDDGMGIGIGCIVCFLLLGLFRKISVGWKKFWISFGSIAAAFIIYFALGALMQGVPVIERLREFLAVSVGSNSTWALSSMGDAGSSAFFYVYTLVPLVTAVSLMYLLGIMRSASGSQKQLPLWCAGVVLSISGLLFIPRTIVLHNLSNGTQSTALVNYCHWLIAVMGTLIYVRVREKLDKNKDEDKDKDKDKETSYVAAFFASALVLSISLEAAFVTDLASTIEMSPYAQSFEAAGNEKLIYHPELDGEERITLSENTALLKQSLEDVLGPMLGEDGTFLDFANVTGLYALLGRENPAYVAQTPSLVTNEYSQECFIREIERNGKVRAAITAAVPDYYTDGIIGIRHNIRYYKIAEYLYGNFEPVCRVGDYLIWGPKSNDASTANQSASQQLSDQQTQVASRLRSEMPQEMHCYDLQQIPYLWAQKDRKDAINGQVIGIPEKENDEIYLIPENVKNQPAYIAFAVSESAGYEQTCDLKLLGEDGEELSSFIFTILPGEYSYLIRISSEMYWYSEEAVKMSITTTSGASAEQVRVIEGD